jgi:hypothetical protein
MSMFSQFYDKYVTGIPSGLENTVTKGMQQFITDQSNMGTQLGDYAKSAMAFQSGQNQAQRQMLQDQASRATAMGGMQAQRMAAQQGMGGSGLLQQAQANQAYQNMMGAGTSGLQAFLNQQRLGAGYLGNASEILRRAGEQQSELNISRANIDMARQRGRNQLLGGLIGDIWPGSTASNLLNRGQGENP